MLDLRLAVGRGLLIPAYRITDASRSNHLAPARLPLHFVAWHVEGFRHARSYLFEAHQRLGVKFYSVGCHELHPSIDALLSGGLSEVSVQLHEGSCIVRSGRKNSGKKKEQQQFPDFVHSSSYVRRSLAGRTELALTSIR